ncbi:MAG: type II secretion system F family protein [Dehalococcoidia bacterium]
MPLLVAAFACITVTLLLFALLGRREDTFRQRLRGMSTYDPDDRRVDYSMPFLERVLYPLTEGLVDRVISILPAGMSARINRMLITAGEPMKFRKFIAMWLVVFVLFGGGGTFALATTGVLSSGFGPLIVLGLLVVSAFLPYSFINTTAKRRRKLIFKALPDSMDLITTSVEAGLGLDAALAKVAEKSQSVLAEELGRALREMAIGRSRREALQEMAERADVPELLTFVGAVIQAEQMGVSLAQVLRVQSEQLRIRRRQKAQEQAMQAPVKMVFPLVFGVFPTLMMIILGPAAITLISGNGIGG